MATVETLQAMFERRLIRQLAHSLVSASSPEKRERALAALRDLVEQADLTLDGRLFDEWTEAQLRLWGLWVWERSPSSSWGVRSSKERTRG